MLPSGNTSPGSAVDDSGKKYSRSGAFQLTLCVVLPYELTTASTLLGQPISVSASIDTTNDVEHPEPYTGAAPYATHCGDASVIFIVNRTGVWNNDELKMVGSLVNSTTCCNVSLYSRDRVPATPALIHENNTSDTPLLATKPVSKSRIGTAVATNELGMYSDNDELMVGGVS